MSGAVKSSRKSGTTPRQENQPAWWDSEEQKPKTSRISLKVFGKKGGRKKQQRGGAGTPRTEESKGNQQGPVAEKRQQRAISDAEGPGVGDGEPSAAAPPSEDAPTTTTSATEETADESGSPRSLAGEISLEEEEASPPSSRAPDPATTTTLEGEPQEGVWKATGQGDEGDALEVAKDTSDVTPLADVDEDQGQVIDKGDVTVEALPDEVSTVASSLLSETATATKDKDVNVCSFCQVMQTLFHRPQRNVEWVQEDEQ